MTVTPIPGLRNKVASLLTSPAPAWAPESRGRFTGRWPGEGRNPRSLKGAEKPRGGGKLIPGSMVIAGRHCGLDLEPGRTS